MTKEEIIEAIANMTVIELSELVKAVEEKFGVSACLLYTSPYVLRLREQGKDKP